MGKKKKKRGANIFGGRGVPFDPLNPDGGPRVGPDGKVIKRRKKKSKRK